MGILINGSDDLSIGISAYFSPINFILDTGNVSLKSSDKIIILIDGKM